MFTATASGNPAPNVQWEVSTDGGSSFSTITTATSTSYSFAADPRDNGYEYEAFFRNSQGSVTTSAATLTVDSVSVTTDPIARRWPRAAV